MKEFLKEDLERLVFSFLLSLLGLWLANALSSTNIATEISSLFLPGGASVLVALIAKYLHGALNAPSQNSPMNDQKPTDSERFFHLFNPIRRFVDDFSAIAPYVIGHVLAVALFFPETRNFAYLVGFIFALPYLGYMVPPLVFVIEILLGKRGR